MLTEGLAVFCKKRKIYKEKVAEFTNHRELSASHHERIQHILCQFLMDPKSTDDVADCFPQMLPALVSATVYGNKFPASEREYFHKLNSVILGKLVSRHHDLLTFVLHYFDVNPAPFELVEIDYKPLPKRANTRKVLSLPDISDHAIVTACYNILCSSPSHFKYKWNWSKFYKYLMADHEEVRWITLNCISIVLGATESCRLFQANNFLSSIQQFLTQYEEDSRKIIASADDLEKNQILKNVQSVVSIGGILLPVFQKCRIENELNLVPVPSTQKNLRNLAFAVSSNKCVCLQGAVGSGKTALVEFLGQSTGHNGENFVKLQLGDQTDSKMLLGMYRCTDIPGEFLWQPGILTEAVTTGKWLLLEDIDCAATDVASVIGHLVESKTLSVPGYRDSIRAKSGFQLFVTRRLASGGAQKSLQVSASLQKHWYCVNVEPLSKEELVTIVQKLFPVLHTVATRIVDVFLLFSVGNHEDDTSNHLRIGRQTSTRDLIKWCSRAVVDFDVTSPDSALKIFQDALDVFCCSVPNCEQRLNLAIEVAHKLGIVKMKAEYFCKVHKPTLNFYQETLTIGRTKLHRKKSDQVQLEPKKSYFSCTRPSMCLLERIASSVAQKEPVLLVGETGTGKTSCVQHLAQITNHKLIVINMNQQSESADLLGGYKPVDLKLLISPIREEFEILFRSYFAIEPNKKFLSHLGRCFEERKWKTLASLMTHSTSAALKRLRATSGNENETAVNLKRWETMAQKLEKLQSQVRSQFSLAFSFVEGSLVKALKNGDWVLLDEINLATAETLECLSGLLEDSCGSLSLIERGDREPIKRHEEFAVFACMNPATDVGKKDLPTGLRNRFTEFFVDELTEKMDLKLLVSSYLGDLNLPPGKLESIVKFYLNVRKEAENSLLDGTGHKPHYSLRTLCRALSVSAQNPCGNVPRTLYEAFSLSFLTQLDSSSYPIVQRMIVKAVLDDKTAKATLGSQIPRPRGDFLGNFVCFEGYWIPRGDLEPHTPENYILTETVKQNLKDLVRVVSIGKMPVLLQGDTSVGKTSLITYLAKASGHTCVRINNHEHTDLQEYVGTYVADSTGKLVFKEGALVDAMRKGYWIILDELNLAPSDVLEALNRVLDDNRELFIPETQQVVKAHDNFMLFATQNPPGLYGGRKVLSRAFRNRFVELHFDEIPAKELQVILEKRCEMPATYCKQVISVMTELQVRRKSTATFAGKKGFITLRDLFRWAERYHLAPDTGTTLYDWSQHLADEGYLVLSSKVRHAEECVEIVQVLKKHLKRDVDPEALFSLSEKTSPVTRPILEALLTRKIPGFEHVVWTFQMRKMAVLLRKACDFKEPVLLIGETGGGKTTVCQLLSILRNQELNAVNCHMHTEASDFLGSLRPVREHKESQKLFEWVDGPLVKAMKTGGFFLADEISLADDSVLERLNSLLEPERKLLVAEKPSDDEDSTIVADEGFIFVGTMNPGGDYGKKELSPALRNRFTEVWCEGCVSYDDLKNIMLHNLRVEFRENVSTAILEFLHWLKTMEIGKKLVVSIRDVLTWVDFVNGCEGLEIGDAFYHGASLSYIDGLGSGLTASENSKKLKEFKDSALKFIETQAKTTLNSKLSMGCEKSDLEDHEDKFGIHPFYVEKGVEIIPQNLEFTFASPTTRMNTLKLLRALQLKKPILLEGSPGVGKTSLVSALARASGHYLLRLNLSDQTDISDLFGADLPVEGGKPGEFSWRDGPFLRALKNGDWILLDELNLASQSVLEGLNACLDHRGEVYVPELGKTFFVKPGTRLFGSQNPLRQGGARRGLPKSFLNRFTQVFVDALEEEDLKFILKTQFPELPDSLLDKMILFNEKLTVEVGVTWAHSGSPWEMNLRDVTRWCQTTIAVFKKDSENVYSPGVGAELIYVDRMRTRKDKENVRQLYEEIFSPTDYPLPDPEFAILLTKEKLHLGNEVMDRGDFATCEDDDLLILREQKAILRDLARCVSMNWMAILVGGTGCGKSSLVRLLANLAGQKLKSIVVNSAMDTTEILGGFEQTDYNRHFEELLERTETLLIEIMKKKLTRENLEQVANYHGLLEGVRRLSEGDDKTSKTLMSSETKLFLRKTEELSKLVSTMKTFEASYELELQGIQKKLTDLSIAVENDKCLNAGGKFEWVDSVLVKCLQNGTWLLLDQVNLCSPAILDRLNGLLEPNGALTIGEKGVDNRGDVFTVRPHKNFRLFLTMDPRYGEISRAMRNRGVEISMLVPNEISSYNGIDMKSLLNKCGIKETMHQDLLLKIHENLSSEKFDLIALLQAASFASQQIAKGFSLKNSLRNSCREIYAVFDSRTRRETLRKIDEILSASFHEKKSFCFDLNAITPRVSDLRKNSRLTMVRQQGFLVKSVADMLGRDEFSKQINLEDLFEDQPSIANSSEFLKHLLLDFYERSSLDDLQIRRVWLSKILSNKHLEDFHQLSETLSAEIENFKFLWRDQSSGELPLTFDKNPAIQNNLSIALHFRRMVLQDDSEEDRSTTKKPTLSLNEYSSAVCSGKLTSQLKSEPLITNFVKLVERSKRTIEAIIRDENFSINVKEFLELRDDIKWYQRFYELGKIELIDKSRGAYFNLRETSATLKVHYRWLLKFFGKFCKLFESKLRSPTMKNELTNFSKIWSNVSIDVDRFKKIRKKMKKLLELPSPHVSEDSMKFQEKIQTLSRKFEIIEEDLVDSSKIRLKIVFLSDNLPLRQRLVDLFVETFRDDRVNSEQVQNILEIEEFTKNVVQRKTIEEDTYKINDNVEEMEIWPIYEYFFFLLARHLQGLICEQFAENVQQSENSLDTTGGKAEKMYEDNISRKFEKIPTIPARLISLLEVLNSEDVRANRRISLLLESFFLIEEFSERSFIAKNSEIILHWNAPVEEDKSNDNSLQTNFINKSTLLDLIFKLLLTKSKKSRATINLGNYKKQKRQLGTLRNLLWKNSLTLNSHKFDISTNDAVLLRFYVKYYFSATESVMSLLVEKLNDEEKHDLELRFFEPMMILRQIEEKLKITEKAIERGKGWLILGYLQMFLFCDLGSIDPVQKIALKSKYIQENILDLEYSICVEKLQSLILGISLKNNSYTAKLDHLKILREKAEKFPDFHAIRPASVFQTLREDIESFSKTIGSQELIFRQIVCMNDLAKTLEEGKTSNIVREKIREASIWKKSLQRFCGKLEKNFLLGFPDLVFPVISAISSLRHGISIMIEEVSNLESRITKKDTFYDLLRFPTVGSYQENYADFIKLCYSEKTILLLNQLDSKSVQKDRLEMSKIALKEFENMSFSVGNLSRSLVTELSSILGKIRMLWRKQETEKQEKLEEEQSLFRRKFDTDKEDEELDYQMMFPSFKQDFLELQEIFPDFRQNFEELQTIPENIPTRKESFFELISSRDAREIREIHWSILKNSQCARKSLINDWKKTKEVAGTSRNVFDDFDSVSAPNFTSPLIQRLEMFGSSMKHLPENASAKLIGSLNVLLSEKSNFETKRNHSRIYDFYRDPNLTEIEECQPVFEGLSKKIDNFLKEWPENPILSSIKAIVDRILGFSIDSALSRFLVGIELLASKIHQWEENARFDVSLAEFIEFFGKKTLHWRKIEITRWKDSLETAENNLKTEASKWWFFLFDLIDQYLEDGIDELENRIVNDTEESETIELLEEAASNAESEGTRTKQNFKSLEKETEELEATIPSNQSDRISKEKLIESMERFLTESSLIQFETRLQLVFLFLQHVRHLENTPKKRELSAIFWNVYLYYSQFSIDVESKINNLKDQIGRKLKDTIKITRWNDVNYWSVKNTAEKTRRTLHKLVKEYQKGLQENVASCLILKPRRQAIEKSPRRDLDPSNFLIDVETGRLKKMEKLPRKARQFCEHIMSKCRYPRIRKDVENFIEESLEESYKLRDLEIDQTLVKSKRQAQAKSILQRKKLALADYFKALTQIGISYRVGILTWKNRENEIVNFSSTPLDLRDMNQFDFPRETNEYIVERGVLEQWKECDKYYYGSLVKLNALDAILNTAKNNDLGPQNAERCRGFSIHLVLLAHRQKTTIANFFERLLPLRIQISSLATMTGGVANLSETSNLPNTTEISDCTKSEKISKPSSLEELPRQRELQSVTKNFRELLITLDIALQQIVIFLESSPEDSIEYENTLDLNRSKIAILQENRVSRDSSCAIKDSLNSIKDMSKEVNSWFSILGKIRDAGQIFFLHQKHFDFLRSSYATIGEIKQSLIKLRDSFTLEHPIAENLVFLIEKIADSTNFFESISKISFESTNGPEDVEKYRRKLDSLMTQILLVIQEKFKENSKPNEETDDVEEAIDLEADLEENALTELLIGSLRKDMADLRSKTVSRIFGELLQILYNLDAQSANDCMRMLLKQLPLLKQYTLLLHYYLYEQVASFRLTCKFLYLQLNVFLDLAANGFCQPQDADPSEQDEEGIDTEGGMGLADGEGKKDVSDRIETEDQLEEAKRPNEEKENDDKKDSKEEENGIDMSENFDSHLQDLEKGDDDEDNEKNEDEDDLDKEMGETEENADKLDKEMWKDEDEENEEENEEDKEDNKKDERGTGEEIGEEELTAKDEEGNQNKNDKEEQEDGRSKDKENKEINEFEEPEVDDDHVDPYHGKNQPEIEPEPFDMPDDIDLDDEMKEDNPGEEENPFDIDQMKESKIPEEKDDEEEPQESDAKEDEQPRQDSSDEGDEEEGSKTDEEKRKEGLNNEEENEKEDSGEKEEEKEKEIEGEKAQPSVDEGSKEIDASEDVDSRKDGSRDAVESNSNQENQETTDTTETNPEDKKDKGTGQSQTEERKGHSGATKEENVPTSGREKDTKPFEKRRKQGQSDENRSLLDSQQEPRPKKLKTAPTKEEFEEREDENQRVDDTGENEIYEHIKNTEEFDDFALDAATEDQVKKQASNLEEDKDEEMNNEQEVEDIEMHEDDQKDEEKDEGSMKKQNSEKSSENKKDKPTKTSAERSEETEEMEVGGEIEGEAAETTRIPRGNESTIHTNLPDAESSTDFSVEQVKEKRFEIQNLLSEWTRRGPSSVEAAAAWSSIGTLTESSARELAEKLRLVLEPTLSSRLKGDYRTGRRINMRKIIPYIASEFRKDKIWLRRTKPSKRDYQVVLAIDDSSSMADNHSKELAFESLSLIGKAMTYLEAGQLAILNFGETVNILHPLGENFTEESGARLIQEMKFEQKKTIVGELLDFTLEMFESQGGSSDNAKLVAILSDGRGIFSEGIEKVNSAVRRAKLSNVFLVFIIVDNPLNKDSILDIRMPVFENGKLLGIQSYMDNFPFPFYIILRDLNTLPVVLSDALRQWFEIVGRIDT